MAVAKFMAGFYGRAIRFLGGVALILIGLLAVTGTVGIIIAIIGLVPIAAAVFDFCLFAPLFGAPLSGKKIRSA